MSSFSQGKWEISANRQICQSETGKTVAYIEDSRMCESEVRANARLIACAPVMYKYLAYYKGGRCEKSCMLLKDKVERLFEFIDGHDLELEDFNDEQ